MNLERAHWAWGRRVHMLCVPDGRLHGIVADVRWDGRSKAWHWRIRASGVCGVDRDLAEAKRTVEVTLRAMPAEASP